MSAGYSRAKSRRTSVYVAQFWAGAGKFCGETLTCLSAGLPIRRSGYSPGRSKSEASDGAISGSSATLRAGTSSSRSLPAFGGSSGASAEVGCGNGAVTNSEGGPWSAVGGGGSILSDLAATTSSTGPLAGTSRVSSNTPLSSRQNINPTATVKVSTVSAVVA